MSQTVEVRFKGNRRAFFEWHDAGNLLRLNEPVLVDVERGLDFGWVNSVGDAALAKCGGCTSCGTGDPPETTVAATSDDLSAPTEVGDGTTSEAARTADEPSSAAAAATAAADRPNVARRADSNAIKQHEELRRGEEDVRRQVIERARAHELPMRISDTEWQWDRGRLSIYFTADRRVDFRALVRELASKFRTRIELRQIGVRDEAARLGGVGRCGREYCCSTWLNEPGPVNLALAKDQHLSLNPAQISGGCGRLLCCLKYEHEFYVTSRKRFPKEGKAIYTMRGMEKVVAVDIFRERVFLKSDEQGPRIVTLLDLRDEVEQAQMSAAQGTAAAAAPATAEPPPRTNRPPGGPRRPRSGPSGGAPA
ncbi:MAG: regulatory iron-sulfur-containing complex subunit RicT [Gemmatimonadales bacterium]